DSEKPSILRSRKPITGIDDFKVRVAIDFPSFSIETYGLYGFAYNSVLERGRLYIINTESAVATPIGDYDYEDIKLGDGPIDIDFNPVTSTLQIIGSNQMQYSIYLADNSIYDAGSHMRYSEGDPNFGSEILPAAFFYTNSYIGSDS